MEHDNDGRIQEMLSGKTIAVIGGGKMGGLFVNALLNIAGVPARDVRVTVKHADHASMLTPRLGLPVTLDNQAAVRDADIVILCVKPQYMTEVLAEIGPTLSAGVLLISIASACTVLSIEGSIERPIAVIRAMPNTACRIQQGMTAFCRGRHVGAELVATAASLFALMGKTAEVDETLMDAVTGLSASGPAFIYIILEALAEGGVRVGLPRDLATTMAAQATLGAAAMVLQTERHPALLKSEVTTPGGCTVEGILELEDGKIRATLIRAVAAAAEKASRLIPQNR